MNGHDVVWTQPPTLTGHLAARLIPSQREVLSTPAILRFTSDSFMQEFMDLLATSPERLADYKVQKETWRGFVPAPVVEPPAKPSIVYERLGILRKRGTQIEPGRERPATISAPAGTPLKLYQPAHQRHYLVICSLVCKVTGLPDKQLEAVKNEQVGYIIRRLLPPDGDETRPLQAWHEYAWVSGSQGYAWQQAGVDPQQIVSGEERLPLFAVHFTERERRRRRLLAGVIPVGRREAYLGAPKANGNASAGVTERTSRKILLRKEVIEPWKALVRRSQEIHRSFVGPFTGEDREPTDSEKAARLRLEREQAQTVSWFILLDLAKYLTTYLRPVWRAVMDPTRLDHLTEPERELFEALESTTITSTLQGILRHRLEIALDVDERYRPADELYSSANMPDTLRAALARFGSGEGLDLALEQQLEQVDQPYDRYNAGRRALWPAFLFPFADPDLTGDAAILRLPPLGNLNAEEQDETALDDDTTENDPLELVDKFAVLVLRALRDGETERAPEPAVPVAALPPANVFEGWFVIRCVYERPGCAPLHELITSAPTEPFQMAGFFDPDAPARPIRIGLPLDTTPAGLRKFDKNTAFVISDTLCGQMRRFKGITLADLVLSVLPWPFHKDLPGGENGPCKTDAGLSLGMICSLSIPIVTICAFVLVTIMVSLFDFVFRWMPYFVICFPIPGLKAKKPPAPA